MSDSPNTLTTEAPARALVETVRKSLAHDVRTPLGTIVNYAAVLESIDDPRASDVHTLARKMRDNAMRAAGMLQQISDAVAVLTVAERFSEFEIGPMLDSCLQGSTSRHAVDVTPGVKLHGLRGHVPMFAFLWRAAFRFDHELRGHAPELVEFTASSEHGELDLRVALGPRAESLPPLIDVPRLIRDEADHVAIDTRLALELALGLVESAGGGCAIHGRPGGSCVVALRIPVVV